MIQRLLLVLAVLAFGCDSEDTAPSPYRPPPPLADQVNPIRELIIPLAPHELAVPPPIETSMLARGRQHPHLMPAICKSACNVWNAKVHRVGPAATKWGWECLCALERSTP